LYSAPSPATIGISDATVVEGDGGTANAVFTVSIEGDFDNVTVDYANVGSAAVEGSDYAATSGTLTFAAGETSQTISVPIIGDTTDEYDEQFFVDLSNAAGGEITDSQGIGTILDDDAAPLVTINDVSKLEGNHDTTFVFTVSLSAASAKWVYVDFATADGTATAGQDYVAASGRLAFAPGETSQTISVPVIGDTVDEYDEQFLVNLSNAAEGVVADSQGIGTIQDDDAAPLVTINDVSQLEGNRDTTFVFTVSLSAASEKWVYVDFATADGTATAGQDYAATSGTLAFAPGELTQTITVTVLGDKKKEPDEFFYVTLSGAVNGQVDDSLALAMILNDDGGGSRKGRK
jgi:hypothetical protein